MSDKTNCMPMIGLLNWTQLFYWLKLAYQVSLQRAKIQKITKDGISSRLSRLILILYSRGKRVECSGGYKLGADLEEVSK